MELLGPGEGNTALTVGLHHLGTTRATQDHDSFAPLDGDIGVGIVLLIVSGVACHRD